MVDPSCAGQTTFVVCPNCSLTWRGFIAFYAAALLFAGSIAVAFALLGYRPVLPFAGLELVALGAGLFVTRLPCDRRELIMIGDNTISVAGNGRCEHLPTVWSMIS